MLSMNNGMVVLSKHESFTAALLAAQEHEDGAARHVDGAWCAVRLKDGTAAAYNRRYTRAANRPAYAGDHE